MGEAEEKNRSRAKSGFDEILTPQMLVRKYASAVLGLCIAHTKNFHDSEDIMQEVFLKAFTKIHTLRDPDRVHSWLLQIARRMCIDYHHKRPTAQRITDDVPAPADSRDEHIDCLYGAISKLPDRYREPITLYYLNGRNCASVARTLGISEDAVRGRLVRARFKLHEILSEDTP
ncbi:MAG: RNA polymerase sigma factor [Planctomycetota bacterium]